MVTLKRHVFLQLSIVLLVAVRDANANSHILGNGAPLQTNGAESGIDVSTGTASLSFRVPFGDAVALRIITAERYGLGDDADEEWSKILPAHGHVVHVAQDASAPPEPHTVTLFHQLKCIDIIRAQYKLPQSAPISLRTGHCLNYLRQTILCKSNLVLESVDDQFGHSDRNFYDTVCRDWTALYREAERNQAAYEGLSMKSGEKRG
ncbi:hypothetical protein GGX14DRAFT_561586 [Mycena pura]|uniref:Ectomycorrhiza-regulated small secreted protein n=1 Tax=Mycena pura TaxID=153505 RepID=A0AAD6VQL5_9AGAR|nr:hypothetical protein GGX14DRAFT_561586 [Mycena pura]